MLKWFADRLAQTGKKVGKEEKGFTLIELLVVVIIIGILAAIAIPAYLAQRDNAREGVVQGDLRQAGTAISTCLLESGGDACNSDTELDAFGFNGSPDVTRTYGGSGNTVTVTGTHADNSSISFTYSSASGNVTATTP